MAKSKTISPNNEGIAGTGIHFLFGSVVQCNAEDDSFYCKFTKIFNIIIMSGVVLLIIYIIFSLIKNYLFGKKNNK